VRTHSGLGTRTTARLRNSIEIISGGRRQEVLTGNRRKTAENSPAKGSRGKSDMRLREKGPIPTSSRGTSAERAEDRKPSAGGLPCMRASRRRPPHRSETHAHGYPGPPMWSASLAIVGCCDAQPLPLVYAAKPRKEGGMLARARHPQPMAVPPSAPRSCVTPTCR
jgi:hypothetical protein